MKNFLLTICRILVGGLFIFSGLIKADDPTGFAIKLEEYFEIFAQWGGIFSFFNSSLVINSTLFIASFLCVLEVALGVCLLLGLWGRLVAWLLLLMILFFTWLTGFSAVTGKVTDCGCFGDAIKLTPWQSFYKDIVLTVLIFIIFIYRKRIKPLFNRVPLFALFFLSTAFCIWIVVHVIRHDVFIDFRPYKKGANISDEMKIPPEAPKPVIEMIYIYKNKSSGDVQQIKMRTDEKNNKEAMDKITVYQNDKNWEFAERKDRIIDKGFIPKISDFAILNEEDNDITQDVLNYEDYVLMIVSSDLAKSNKDAWQKINTVQKAAEADGIFTFALVANARDSIEKFRHANQTAFPFYKGDGKVCLTIIRTNPGILLLKKGTIIDKWAWRDLPDYAEIKNEYFKDRKPAQIQFGNPKTEEMFAENENVFNKIKNSEEPYNEFFIMDNGGNDATQQLLNDTVPVYLFIVRDIAKLTQETYNALLPLMQQLQNANAKWIVVSGSEDSLVQQMKNNSKLNFNYYNSDREVLQKIIPQNTGIIILNKGVVIKKYREGALPLPGQLFITNKAA